MGRFEELTKGKEKELTILGQVYVIKTLPGKYLGLFAEMANSDKETSVKKIVFESLKMSDNTVTMQDVDELPIGYLMDVFAASMEVNGFIK